MYETDIIKLMNNANKDRENAQTRMRERDPSSGINHLHAIINATVKQIIRISGNLYQSSSSGVAGVSPLGVQ
jgi:hypothetical protein